MKKIVSLILIAVMLVLSLASCANTSSEVKAPDGMKLVSGDGAPYYLFVPESWGETKGFGTFGAYASDSSNVSVSTYAATDIKVDFSDDTTPGETTANDTTAAATTPSTDKSSREQYIDAYWEMCWRSYLKELNEFAVVDGGKQTLLGGIDAKTYAYTAKYEGIEYKMQMTVTYSGGLMYILTYTAKSANFDAHAEEVAKIISEFKFA